MDKKFLKRVMVVICCVLLCVLACFSIVAVSIWQYASVDEKQQADAAIVLGAGATDSGVSPVFRERINHGIWLYENGYVEYLVLTGGVGEGNRKSDAAIAKEYAVSCGVPEDIIFLEEKSVITEENLHYSVGVMDAYGMETAIVVSDPLHMKRAMLMATDYGITAYSSPTPSSMYKSPRTQLPFLLREIFFYVGYCIVRIFR